MDTSSLDGNQPQCCFSPIPYDVTGVDVTQRDRFNNERFDLVHSPVREATRNSIAQPSADVSVTLRFTITTPTGEGRELKVNLIFPLEANRKAYGLETDALDGATARILVVEDCNATVPIEVMDSHDDGNFAGLLVWAKRDPTGGLANG